MLIGGSVKHHVRLVARKELADARLILRVADDCAHGERRIAIGKLLRDRIKRELGKLEEHEARRREARNLAAQLGADRSARAGDEHRAALEEAVQAGVIERYRIASEQVIELDRAQCRDADPPGNNVAE